MRASEIAQALQLSGIIHSEDSACLTVFSKTLENAPEMTVETFLSGRPQEDCSELVGLVAIEMRHRLGRGIPCSIESYIERFPELRQNREQALDLIYAEYCQRQRHSQDVRSEEYFQRFPDYRQSLERLFRIHSLFGDDPSLSEHGGEKALELPDVGDEFLDFRLVCELGRGSFGRVFLAEQTNLSDRQVVVKITPVRTIEHQTLARLEHPNIVPVLSVHRDELSGLQAVCMPYQGAVALSDVLTTWQASDRIPTKADVFLQGIHKLVPPELRKADAQVEGSQFPAHGSYVHGCAWIMHKLAGALHHAHLRGIYHRDIKPSNILLTAAGQPLLVDFNLAFNQEESGGDRSAFLGGTLPYMPPEQLQALHPAESGRPDDVGPRSDIYSLAATIFELLTGKLPFALPENASERLQALRSQLELRYAGAPSAQSLSPGVPADLDALLSKCLDSAPYRRYETASQLTNELERFIQDRPLRYIGKIPKHVVIQKLIRRNRRRFTIASATLAAALLLATGFQVAKEIQLRAARVAHEKQIQDAQVAHEMELVAERDPAFVKLQAELEALPQDPYRYYWKGYELYGQGRLKHAIYAFDRAEEIGEITSRLYFYRGKSHAKLDEDAKALADYSRALQINPDKIDQFRVHAYKERAILFATSRTCPDHPKALRDAALAWELRGHVPDDQRPVLLYDIASVYSSLSKSDPTHLEQAVELVRMAIEDHGILPESLRGQFADDRYKMLEPVLQDARILRLLTSEKR